MCNGLRDGLEARPPHGTPTAAFFTYLGELTSGKPVPMPEGETWYATTRRITVARRLSQIDKRTYWHFLEVLPPRFLYGTIFAFAEGLQPLLLFVHRGEKYLCRQLSWRETEVFCRIARVPLDYWAY